MVLNWDRVLEHDRLCNMRSLGKSPRHFAGGLSLSEKIAQLAPVTWMAQLAQGF